jgi:hypothetical protein
VFASILAYTQSYLLAAMLFSAKYTTLYLHIILVNVPKGVTKNAMFTLIYRACRFDFIEVKFNDYVYFETEVPKTPHFDEIGYES